MKFLQSLSGMLAFPVSVIAILESSKFVDNVYFASHGLSPPPPGVQRTSFRSDQQYYVVPGPQTLDLHDSFKREQLAPCNFKTDFGDIFINLKNKNSVGVKKGKLSSNSRSNQAQRHWAFEELPTSHGGGWTGKQNAGSGIFVVKSKHNPQGYLRARLGQASSADVDPIVDVDSTQDSALQFELMCDRLDSASLYLKIARSPYYLTKPESFEFSAKYLPLALYIEDAPVIVKVPEQEEDEEDLQSGWVVEDFRDLTINF